MKRERGEEWHVRKRGSKKIKAQTAWQRGITGGVGDGASVKKEGGRERAVFCHRQEVACDKSPRLIHNDCRAERMLNPQRERERDDEREKTGRNRANKRVTDCKEWM